MTGSITVRGGAGGVEAHYDDMTAAARYFGDAALDTGSSSAFGFSCNAVDIVVPRFLQWKIVWTF